MRVAQVLTGAPAILRSGLQQKGLRASFAFASGCWHDTANDHVGIIECRRSRDLRAAARVV